MTTSIHQNPDYALKQRLKLAGLRATPHRVRVLTTLQTLGYPVSHNELINALKDAQINRVTLYRVLSSLTDNQIVHSVQGTDGIWRFCYNESDLVKCPGGHPHLLCEVCHDMFCLTHTRMPHIEVPDDFIVKHKQMLIVGICPRCRDK